MSKRVTRFSGADWFSEQRDIMIIGIGGIGSWLAINLSRIGHELYLIDPDVVDETNVTGGQAYRTEDIGRSKGAAVTELCRSFGCSNLITTLQEEFSSETGMVGICITGLDNMKARKLAFDEWKKHLNNTVAEGGNTEEHLFIDGRLLMENMEILCVQGNNEEQIKEYREKYLFNDEEVAPVDCTAKQSTFGAMIIAGLITSTLCNWLTNRKLGMEFRETPLYQRFYLPILDYKQINIEQNVKEEEATPV